MDPLLVIVRREIRYVSVSRDEQEIRIQVAVQAHDQCCLAIARKVGRHDLPAFLQPDLLLTGV